MVMTTPKNGTPGCEFVAAIRVEISEPIVIGNSGAGIREIFPITGGDISGPKLTGSVVPGGADWALQRANGGYRVWARYTLKLSDGTLVLITNAGLVHLQADGHYGGRTVAEFEVADGPHDWLRDSIFIGTLHGDSDNDYEILIELWRLT